MIRILLITVGSLLLMISCMSSGENTTTEIIINESDIVEETIGVAGMTCVGCEVTLEQNIAKIEGVVDVKASHTNSEAIIEFDSTKTDIKTIARTIKDSGYELIDK